MRSETKIKDIKQKSVLNNFVFQLLYQLVVLLTPFIVSPYLTRTLGGKSLGDYTYVFSIASYFVLLANLGISKHGQRIISKNIKNKEKVRRVFWSLFYCHLLVSVFALIAYFSFILIFCKENQTLFLIEGLVVFSAAVDITWLFFGLQNFKSTAIKTIVVKVLEVILIFTLIKGESDIYIYALLASLCFVVGNLILLPQAIAAYKPIKVTKADLFQHIKPLLYFSISVVAVTLYTVFDKTLLGLMTPTENVAFYEYADRIIRAPIMLITAAGTVLFPKSCQITSEGDVISQKKYLKISVIFVCFIGSLSLFGFLSLAQEFSILYYGSDFAESGFVMQAMCAMPLIVGLGDIVRTQIMIPNEMDRQYIISVSINAVLNIIISVSLIPVIGIYGAVLGTLTAELIGTVFQIWICRKRIPIIEFIKILLPFLLFGAIMYIFIVRFKTLLPKETVYFVFEALLGSLIFSFVSAVYLSLYQAETWNIFKKRIKNIALKKTNNK